MYISSVHRWTVHHGEYISEWSCAVWYLKCYRCLFYFLHFSLSLSLSLSLFLFAVLFIVTYTRKVNKEDAAVKWGSSECTVLLSKQTLCSSFLAAFLFLFYSLSLSLSLSLHLYLYLQLLILILEWLIRKIIVLKEEKVYPASGLRAEGEKSKVNTEYKSQFARGGKWFNGH